MISNSPFIFYPSYFNFLIVYFDTFFIRFNLIECLSDIRVSLFELGFKIVGGLYQILILKGCVELLKNKKSNRGLTSIF